MDALSERLAAYLRLMHSSALLVSEGDRANMDVLLTMLGALDKGIVENYFGLGGMEPQSIEQLAARYEVTVEQMRHIIATDLRRIAISPEWQMMWRKMPKMVSLRVEHDDVGE